MQVEHRDLALVLDLAAPAHDAGAVELDLDDPGGVVAAHARLGAREAPLDRPRMAGQPLGAREPRRRRAELAQRSRPGRPAASSA